MKGTGWFLSGLLAKAHDFDDVDSKKPSMGATFCLQGCSLGMLLLEQQR